MDTIGERIRKARLARGWSGQELAHRAGYKTQSGISNLENRSTGSGGHKVAHIANVLRVPLDWLLNGSDSDEVPLLPLYEGATTGQGQEFVNAAHITLDTLLTSIERSEGKRYTHAELARALNVSEQVVTNWASRGISVEGALAAQFVFQKDANYILGRVSHPMLLPRNEAPAPTAAYQAREPSVSYLPEPKPDERSTELHQLFSKLDDEGKSEWLADLRGFVRGRRPHSNGHPAKVANKK